jgi:hypothetical protein
MDSKGAWPKGLAILAILFLLGGGFAAYALSPGVPVPSSAVAAADASPSAAAAAIGNALSYAIVPLPTYLGQQAPANYPFQEGGGLVIVSGHQLELTIKFLAAVDSRYVIVLETATRNVTIGKVTTGPAGGASFKSDLTLASGTYQFGLLVFVAGQTAESPVGVSTPRAIEAVLGTGSSSSTSSTSSGGSTQGSGGGKEGTTTATTTTTSASTAAATASTWVFSLTPIPVVAVPQGYRFAGSGTAAVTFAPRYSLVEVRVGFQDANPSTTYGVVLTLNGTIMDVGAMTTNKAGSALLQASLQIPPGRYMLGVRVYDISTFKVRGPVAVLTSDPLTQLVTITPASQTVLPSSSSASSSSSSTNSTSTTGAPASTVSSGTVWIPPTTIAAAPALETEIQDAVTNSSIPATVQVTPLSTSTSVSDPRFSLSVGDQVGNGLIVSISGENVTGPRVLLINMSQTSPLALYPALNVTLDGSPVPEASSILQVLNPQPGAAAAYVLISTSTSEQLLVDIPHFSEHVIQVTGEVLQSIASALELDAPLLAGSILVITLIFVGTYVTRRKFFSAVL